MSVLDVESMLAGLRHARHEAIMSYDSDIEGEEAGHLLNCLLDVELAIGALERASGAGVLRTARKTSEEDIEPSAGDVVEAPDNPVDLARAMQQKRHGGAT